jgi:hypothetical protein
VPPAADGNIELVATSKTPQPQAQAWLFAGVNVNTVVETSPSTQAELAIELSWLVFIYVVLWLPGRAAAARILMVGWFIC